jgi:hypothetical protein
VETPAGDAGVLKRDAIGMGNFDRPRYPTAYLSTIVQVDLSV